MEGASGSVIVIVIVDDSPGSPTNVKAVAVSSDTIEVSWTAPEHRGRQRATAYAVAYQDVGRTHPCLTLINQLHYFA